MTPRFQADADFNHKIILALRRREPSIDFMDAKHSGVVGASDFDVLQISADFGRILVSHYRNTMPADFARFIQDRSSPGLILVEQSLDIGAEVVDLLLTSDATDAKERHDQIGFLPL